MLVIEVVIISLKCLQLTSLLFHQFMINVFSGSFPPKMWNLYNKSVDLTNNKAKANKTEVTTVKLVLFKYVMSFETLTKVDQLTKILRFGLAGKSWLGDQRSPRLKMK